MSFDPLADLADLIGQPWDAEGRSGWNCATLAVEVRRRMGLTVPAVGVCSADDGRAVTLLDAACGELVRLEGDAAPQAGDVGLYRLRGCLHVAAHVDPWRLIHIMEGGRVRIDRADAMETMRVGRYR